MKKKIVFEMETSDPDDFITLLRLLDHPKVDLIAVVVTPGYPDQIGLVRWALKQFNISIPVGAYKYENKLDRVTPKAVSQWHYDSFGDIHNSYDALDGGRLLADILGYNITFLTGAPPKNLGRAMEIKGQKLELGVWVAQGGFAGDNVVPKEYQLDKFKGLTTCQTFNLNGAPGVVKKALDHKGIQQKFFVSKNVCHGVLYDKEMHEKVRKVKNNYLSLNMIWESMELYLKKKDHKALHDPLAAMCAIDRSIGLWSEVEVYRDHKNGEWGSRLMDGTNTWIIVDYYKDKFFELLVE